MKLHRLCLLLFLCVFVGCASIPPEAPTLSQELGNRISSIEDANINLLHKFFDQKREQIDEFIQKEWVPTFAEEFFSLPKISNAWDTIVKENNKQDRLKFIVLLGPKLQSKINNKRLELIKPLDDLERKIEGNIRSEFNQARAINSTITSFLFSASKVDENRKKYLEMIGVKDEKLTNVINKTDDICNELVEKSHDVKDKVDAGLSFVKKIKELKAKI